MDDMGYSSQLPVESAEHRGIGEIVGVLYFAALAVAAVAGIVVGILAVAGVI